MTKNFNNEILEMLSTIIIMAVFFIPTITNNNTSHGLLDPFYDSSGLVGYWSFNGEDTNWGTNTTNDLSGNGNHGTMTNMSQATSPTIGKLGQALKFDGINDWVETGDTTTFKWMHGANDPSSFQVSTAFWMKLNTADPDTVHSLVSTEGGSSANRGYGIWYDDRSGEGFSNEFFLFIVRGVAGQAVASVRSPSDVYPNDTDWHHVVTTYDQSLGSNNANIYIDGALVHSGNKTGNIPSTNNSSYNLHIGSLGSEIIPFPGSIDEVLIYNKALTQTEITQLYNTGKATHSASQTNKLTDGLVLMQSFDGADINWGTNTATDRSGQGNHGTLINMSQATSPTDGKIGQALDFDGGDDRVVVSDSDDWYFGNDDFAISFWANSGDVVSPGAGVINQFQDGTHFWYTFIDVNEAIHFRFYYGSQKTYFITANSFFLTDNNWHNYQFVRSGNDFILYRDGISQSYTTNQAFSTDLGNYASNLEIGRGNAVGGFNDWFDGKIDEVRVYNRALPQTEITQLYNTGKATHSASQTNKLTDGLVLMQSFDGNHMDWSQGSAEARDQSGQGNHGDVVGAIATDGKVGQALSFDGSDDYVNIGDPVDGNLDFGTSDFAGCAWIESYSTINDRRVIFAKQNWDTYTNGWVFEVFQDETLRFWRNDGNPAGAGGEIQQTSTTITLGEKTFACLNYKYNNEVEIYINGVEASYGSNTFGTWATLSNGFDFLIGSATGSGREFNGSIDEVRVYNRALSQSEITQLYNMGKSKISN